VVRHVSLKLFLRGLCYGEDVDEGEIKEWWTIKTNG
jgi:hypothetical protein